MFQRTPISTSEYPKPLDLTSNPVTWTARKLSIGRRSRKPRTKDKTSARWQLIRKITEWARGEYFPAAGPARQFSRLLDEIGRVVEVNGVPGSILWIKRRRSEYLQYLSHPHGSPEEKVFRNRLIQHFGRSQARVLLKRSSPVIRMTLTALTALRSFTLPVRVDVSSVVAPFTGTDTSTWRPFVKRFWHLLKGSRKIGHPNKVLFHNYHFTLKAGPNGPALWTALSDLVSLPGPLARDICTLGGFGLASNMQSLLNNLHLFRSKPDSKFFNVEPGKIRKLVGIADLEGKTRVIAILDYWSQTALRPVHQFLFGVLREIPQDMTFTQGAFLDHVKSWNAVKLYSIDLTTATDRFPIDLIAGVLEGHFGKTFAQAWKNVLVGYPFETPTGENVFYSVGNPMGAMSSWSSFALAHHFVVFWCCERLGVKWKTAKYVILGDDVLIGDPALAELYMSSLTSLGVEFSSQKTYVSEHFGEFAKRFLFEGDEVTPFPVSAVLEGRGDVSLLVSSMMGETRKNLWPTSGIPGAVGSLSRVIGRDPRVVSHLIRLARDVELSSAFVQGYVEAKDFIRGLNHSLDEPSLDFLSVNTEAIIQATCRKVLHDSLSSSSGDLGPAFLDEVEFFTGKEVAERVPGVLIALVPSFSVLSRFSLNAGNLYLKGIRSIEGDNGDLSREILSEFFVSPLSERTWKVDARGRKLRAWGRFGTTLRRECKRFLKRRDPLETRKHGFHSIPTGDNPPKGPIRSIWGILRGLPNTRVVKWFDNR